MSAIAQRETIKKKRHLSRIATMAEPNDFDATTFLNGLASYKGTELQKRPIRSVLVDFLKQNKVRKEVESALASGFSRKALVAVLSEQRKVSMPTLRRALDEVFPKKRAGQALVGSSPSARPGVALPQKEADSGFAASSGHAAFDEDPR
ncbi:MAG: hypothetical protein ACYC8W_07760 [Candidatus Tyrphobacter sp.]